MNRFKRLKETEPVTLGAAIIGVVQAVIVLAMAFGVEISSGQQAAILGAVAAILALAVPVAMGRWQRGQVTPVAVPQDNDGNALVPIGQTLDGQSTIEPASK